MARANKCRRCRAALGRADTGRPRLYCSNACRQAGWWKRHKKPRTPHEAMASSRSVEYSTDPKDFAGWDQEFGPFDLDAAASPANAKCPRFFTAAQDGLRQRWTGKVWLNPPYGRGVIGRWLRKAWESVRDGTAEVVVCLVPARPTVNWWLQIVKPHAHEVRDLPGRLKFNNGKQAAPYGCSLVVFRQAVRP